MVTRRERPSQATSAGPAYYHEFKPREPWAGPTDYGRRVSAEIQAKLKAFAHKRPNKSWAPKILARHAAGEHFSPLVLDMARAVAQPVEREPGSDDE